MPEQVTCQVVIESKSLTPEQISELVGAPWDDARRIGDRRARTEKIWDCNVWKILNRKASVDYPGQSAHDLFAGLLEEFLERLKAISEGLRRVIATEGGEFGVYVTSTFVPGIHFQPEAIRIIADLGLSIDIDVILISSDET